MSMSGGEGSRGACPEVRAAAGHVLRQGIVRAADQWTCPAPGAMTERNAPVPTDGLQKWVCPPGVGLKNEHVRW